MTQLAAFETEENSHCFNNPAKYWHRQVFGQAARDGA